MKGQVFDAADRNSRHTTSAKCNELAASPLCIKPTDKSEMYLTWKQKQILASYISLSNKINKPNCGHFSGLFNTLSITHTILRRTTGRLVNNKDMKGSGHGII
jgi:hypothetical protein